MKKTRKSAAAVAVASLLSATAANAVDNYRPLDNSPSNLPAAASPAPDRMANAQQARPDSLGCSANGGSNNTTLDTFLAWLRKWFGRWF